MQPTQLADPSVSQQNLRRGLTLMATLGLLTLLAAACSSSSSIGAGDARDDAFDHDAPIDAPGDGLQDAAVESCEPTFSDCADLCGPVRDRCTGEIHQCGACLGDDLVCDLETNTCGPPLDDCKELNFECGPDVRNSCGGWVKNGCGYCPTDQECDPDTNTCVDCKDLTCMDLGFECGSGWLGCGNQLTNQVDCGTCTDPNETCNERLRLCEPTTCSGKTDAELCAEASAERGVQCSEITNGCGSMIDCTAHLDPCPAGTACGILGVANRCDPLPVADECLSLGAECNYKDRLKSKCTDGQGNPVTLYCGECTEPDVCNANNKCGPACEPKTCADLEANQCGTQLDDGCDGKMNCGCTDTKCNISEIGKVGNCVTALDCEDYTDGHLDRQVIEDKACSNGNAFDDGTGTLFRCRCASGLLCIDADNAVVLGANQGTCCKNTNPTCSGENGPCQVTNSCTGASSNCCTGSLYCQTSSTTCKERLTCDYYQRENNGAGAWKSPIPCSNTAIAAFAPIPGGTEEMACRCPSPNHWCINQSGETPGECCEFDATAACEVIANRINNCEVRNPCTGGLVSCCTSSQYCDATSQECVDRDTCIDIVDFADRRVPKDERCSNDAAFDDGSGDLIACRCLRGLYCTNSTTGPGRPVSGSETGHCCENTGPSCSGAGGPCTVNNSCLTNSTTNCCTGNLFCNGSNRCEAKRTCSYYSATGAVGSICGTFEDGAGGNIECDCSTSGGRAKNECEGRTCVCSENSCNNDCRRDGKSDGCGRLLDCECSGSQVCNPTDGECCTQPACTAGGVPRGDPCRTTECGLTRVCPCANQYDTCGGGDGPNVCGCTPTVTSCGGYTGPGLFDGCGTELYCGG